MNLDDIDPDHVCGMDWWGHSVCPIPIMKKSEWDKVWAEMPPADYCWSHPSAAEELLEIAKPIVSPSDKLVAALGWEAGSLELAKVAIDLHRMPASSKLRAQVEGWDRQRIIREMY